MQPAITLTLPLVLPGEWTPASASLLAISFALGLAWLSRRTASELPRPAAKEVTETTPLRRPAASGDFYPSDPAVLRQQVHSFLNGGGQRVPAIACLVPHDGYALAGHVAGAVWARLELPKRFIFLCPAHHGRGRPLSIMTRGAWETPLGRVEIDRDLADALRARYQTLVEDEEAHRQEWGIEVQLPFLQVLQPGFSFVPITVGVGHLEPLMTLGEALASVVAKSRSPILIVASTDMHHYEADSVTRAKDDKVLEQLLALDARGLFDSVGRHGVNMCGHAAAVAMLCAAIWLGAESAELVKHATSGDVSGNREAVVGYAGVLIR
jgi:AmmeMemoRadiSam system protein B